VIVVGVMAFLLISFPSIQLRRVQGDNMEPTSMKAIEYSLRNESNNFGGATL
jgi:hypothetical protein